MLSVTKRLGGASRAWHRGERIIDAAGSEHHTAEGDRMPVSDRDDLRVGDHRIRSVRWTWGMDFPPERRWTDGWGLTVELPAVLELLDLISDGSADADTARRALAEQAAALGTEHDPNYGDEAAQKFARCFGDCDICQAAEAGFRRDRSEAEERASKARDHESYPYLIRGRTAHLSTCHHVAPQRHHVEPLQDREFRQQLRWHAHGKGNSLYPGEPVDWNRLLRWAEANTGPHGGKHYRACKDCKPPLP